MGERELQHWVPQHHMRLFSGGSRRIGLVTRSDRRVVLDASIRHQCARHMFYGDKDVEAALGRLESHHAHAYRVAIAHAWESGPPLSAIQMYKMREALILQHARTPSQAATSASSMDQMTLHTYAEHLRASSKSKASRAVVRAIEEGRARLKHSRAFALQLALSAVQETAPLARDLALRIVRNRSALPFLLGDAPCIYSNHYQRAVTAHGVLGLTSQGLMITMPLDTKTCVVAFDPGKYRFSQSGSVVDLVHQADALRFNRLQAMAAESCVYFSGPKHASVALTTMDDCPRSRGEARGGFRVLEQVDQDTDAPPGTVTFRPVEGDQRTARGDLLMIFQHQLPETLDLSFVETAAFEGVAEAYGPRCRSLVEEFESANRPVSPGPLGIDELVRNVEAQLETW